MNFSERSNKKELLDGENIPYKDILLNMQELEFINRYLGGHQITLNGFEKIRNQEGILHVCEIGCGGGDNLAAIARWCGKKGLALQVTGIDWKDTCIRVAKENQSLKGKATWICSDYRDVLLESPPDIIFSSLFCHHFSNKEIIEQLKWMYQNCRLGFFINDLHRHWLAYLSIKFLTALFSRSYLVKHDAPVSVSRGFLKKEWKSLLKQADLPLASVQWKWAFRHLILVSKNTISG